MLTSELTMLFARGEAIGYARAGTYIAEDLASRGVDVYNDDGHPKSRQEMGAHQRLLRGGNEIVVEGRRTKTEHTNAMMLVSVPTHLAGYWEGQYKSILTMWEAMTLPESFRDTLHEFDLLMVPSWHNRDLFSQYHDNVQLVLLGVDPLLWHYRKPTPPGPFFDFLISGAGAMPAPNEPGPRKGTDIAYRAFRTVFKDLEKLDPQPRLIVKSMFGVGEMYGANIQHVTGRLGVQAELDLYASCHAYIQPSRGEGFGLQPLQALAMGRPTILTNAHGHESYAHLGIGLGWKPAKANYFIYGDAGEWWEPSLEETCEAMWDVYNHYDEHCHKARASADEIAKCWTWTQTTDSILTHLGDAIHQPYSGSGVWTDPKPKLYKIVTTRDKMFESAGRTLYFQKGVEYYDFADIKRLVFENGCLDVSCLDDDDHGLAEVQALQLGKYRADHENCPSCGQPLNSAPTAADRIYEELEAAASRGESYEPVG